MALDTGMKCIKYLLFFFNLIFVISGVILIIVGALAEVFYKSYLDFLKPGFLTAPQILIAAGCLIFIVGFFGCCGAAKENHCMVVTFSVLLLLIFVLQLAAGITAYVMRKDVKDFLEQNMKKTMHDYNETVPGLYKTWNVIQHENKCCGTDGYKDWLATPYGESVQGVPDACCIENTVLCGHEIFNNPNMKDKIYQTGCFEELKESCVQQVTIIGAVAIAIAIIQLLGVVFACCLAKSLKHQYETV